MGIVDDDVDGNGIGRGERVGGVGIERENPCLFGFFLEPLVDGRYRGGGRVRADELNLDWMAFANESVDSEVWPGLGLVLGTLVEKKSWSAIRRFPVDWGCCGRVKGEGITARTDGERKEKGRDYSTRDQVGRQ